MNKRIKKKKEKNIIEICKSISWEYMHRGYPTYWEENSTINYNPDSLTVGIIGNKLLATTENLVGEQDINYCPICGKKLDS